MALCHWECGYRYSVTPRCCVDFTPYGAPCFGRPRLKVPLIYEYFLALGRQHALIGKVTNRYLLCIIGIGCVNNLSHFFGAAFLRRYAKPTYQIGELLSSYKGYELRFSHLPFDHPLVIAYSSGTTGLPKPIIHCAGGVLLQRKLPVKRTTGK